jgi:hypothetical protein
MKKFLVLILITVIATSSCSVLGTGTPVSNVDTQATIDAKVRQSQAQTQAALPSLTTVLPTASGTPVVLASPTTEFTATSTFTPAPNLTTTPATATNGPANNTTTTATATATKSVSSSGSATVTPTLGILKYGTLPPAVPYANIKIFNKSKAQAYISLQNDAVGRSDTILEYPVKKEVHTKAPLGYYVYVVWVGGREITGEFYLNDGDDLTIVIYKDKVTVQ